MRFFILFTDAVRHRAFKEALFNPDCAAALTVNGWSELCCTCSVCISSESQIPWYKDKSGDGAENVNASTNRPSGFPSRHLADSIKNRMLSGNSTNGRR